MRKLTASDGAARSAGHLARDRTGTRSSAGRPGRGRLRAPPTSSSSPAALGERNPDGEARRLGRCAERPARLSIAVSGGTVVIGASGERRPRLRLRLHRAGRKLGQPNTETANFSPLRRGGGDEFGTCITVSRGHERRRGVRRPHGQPSQSSPDAEPRSPGLRLRLPLVPTGPTLISIAVTPANPTSPPARPAVHRHRHLLRRLDPDLTTRSPGPRPPAVATIIGAGSPRRRHRHLDDHGHARRRQRLDAAHRRPAPRSSVDRGDAGEPDVAKGADQQFTATGTYSDSSTQTSPAR